MMLLLTGCSWTHRESSGKFRARAEEVVERWQGSADDRAWRTGFVPLNGLQVGRERIPAWAALSEHNGVWSLETGLPVASAATTLKWPDGAVSQVPVVSATEAYRLLSEPAEFIDEECPKKGCRPLRVTRVALGDAPLETSRGTIKVPVWYFTVKGVEERFAQVAVDPSATLPRPEGMSSEVRAFEAVPGRPAELVLTYGYGMCDRVHGVRTYETDESVVVDVDEESSGGLCLLALRIGRITVTLHRPLGDRLLLDSVSGLPVVRGTVQARRLAR
jgi:hypothetical protein